LGPERLGVADDTETGLERLGITAYAEEEPRKAGWVDFDNDGAPDLLVRLQYASGAGRGCDYEHFDLLNEARDSMESSPRRELLRAMQGLGTSSRSAHPVPSCEGNVTGWFRYNGVTYLETKYRGDQPTNTRQEFHTVSYIENGQIRSACEARFRKHVEVQR
jgi:hypothetical protein